MLGRTLASEVDKRPMYGPGCAFSRERVLAHYLLFPHVHDMEKRSVIRSVCHRSSPNLPGAGIVPNSLDPLILGAELVELLHKIVLRGWS